MAPHNLTLTVIGASLVWVGWFGFNGGSALGANGSAGYALVVTQAQEERRPLHGSSLKKWFVVNHRYLVVRLVRLQV